MQASALQPRSRFILFYVVPSVLLLGAAVLPLITGVETLYTRDVFSVHLEMKTAQAEAMRNGYVPVIDPYRAGGQPHLGNLNTVPLYPDNLLYLVASTIWALNAHFWIHLLIAPFAFFWLGREWGLRAEAAWAAGVIYASSGFFLSNFNLYNLIAGAALAPALIAATMALGREHSGKRLVVLAVLWMLIIFSGDPMTAVLAVVLAVSAVLVKRGWSRRGALWVVVAFGFGTLMAAPQIVPFWRILPHTFRGHWGYSALGATAASWNPLTAFEWFIPFAFGTPDLAFWGQSLTPGHVPIYLSLYPGVLALGFVAASGRPDSRFHLWAWSAVGFGLFFSMGQFNPIFNAVIGAMGSNPVRLPGKMWLAVAVGAGLLCGQGFERILESEKRIQAIKRISLLILPFGTMIVFLYALPKRVNSFLRGHIPDRFPLEFVDHERLRWAESSLLAVVILLISIAILVLLRRQVLIGGAAVITLHLATQMVLMSPLIETDQTAFYREPPPLSLHLPVDGSIAQGSLNGLMGESRISLTDFPDQRLMWLRRRNFLEMYPEGGVPQERRYEFNLSPEGLDSFLTVATTQAMLGLSDVQKLKLLAVSGVETLIMSRPLESDALAQATLLRREASLGREVYAYRLLDPVPRERFVSNYRGSAHLNDALSQILAPTFDPRTMTVLAGEVEQKSGPGGDVEVLQRGPEVLEARVDARSAGVFVTQRSFLPIYKATVDGLEARPVVADLHRLALQLPAGSHQVKIWVDRGPWRAALLVATAALLALLGTAGAMYRRSGVSLRQ
jgi:hypothetical protein